MRWVIDNQAAVHEAMLERRFEEYPEIREQLECGVKPQLFPETKAILVGKGHETGRHSAVLDNFT